MINKYKDSILELQVEKDKTITTKKKEMEKKENELDQSNLFCLDHE